MLFSEMLILTSWMYFVFANILAGILPPTLLLTCTHRLCTISSVSWIVTFSIKVVLIFSVSLTPSCTVYLFYNLLSNFAICYSYLYLPFFFSTRLRVAWICGWHLPLFFYNSEFVAYNCTPGRWSVKVRRIALWLLRTVSL